MKGLEERRCVRCQNLQASRLRWFDHVKRRDEDYVGKGVIDMEAEGNEV